MKGAANLPFRGASFNRDWTKGSIIDNLWALSWPLLIIYIINTLGPTIDMIWVGRLGAASIAGVGISGLAVTVVTSLQSGLFTGTTALIARFIGAGDERNANLVAQQAFVIGVAFSLFTAIIGIFLAKPILVWLGASPDVIIEGAVYMRIQLVGMVTMGAISVAQSIMQASGDSVTPLKISIIYRILQIVLCPALVFGWWLFPRLGVRGAALSNVISQGMGGALALWVLFSGQTRLSVTLRNFRFEPGIIWRSVKIGIPAAISFMERSFADLILVWFIIPFGTFAVAAHSLAQRIDMIIQMLAAGFGMGAGVLAAQNLGAGQPERATRTAWLAVGLSTCILVICSLVIWFWAEHLLRIFNSQLALVEMAGAFLRIQIVSYLVWGVVITLSMCLNSVGDTLMPMLTNLTTMWGVQLTLAFFLPRATGLGVYGIRWAMVSGIVARAVIYPIYFKTGGWQRKKV